MNIHSVASVCQDYRQRVRIDSRSKSAADTSVSTIQMPNNPSPTSASAVADSQNDPVNCATSSAVSGMMISTPNCCAVRASLTRDEMTSADCSETSAAAGPTTK